MQQKQVRQTRFNLWMVGFLLLATTMLWVACGRNGQTSTSVTIGETVTAFSGNVAETVSTTGIVSADKQTTLSLGIAGVVQEVNVAVGEPVKKGDILLQLDTADLERKVANAELALANTKASYDEVQRNSAEKSLLTASATLTSTLEQLGLLDEEGNRVDQDEDEENDVVLTNAQTVQLAQAEASVAQAEATLAKFIIDEDDGETTMAEAQISQAENNLAEAEANLAKATLTAPFDGVVATIYVAEGEHANGKAVELIDPDTFLIVAELDETDLTVLAVGQSADVVLSAYPDTVLHAEVMTISPTADQATGNSSAVNYAVKLQLESYEEVTLREGLSADVDFIAEERDGVVLIPNRAISADPSNGSYYVNRVVTIGETRSLEKITVLIGLRDGNNTEVEAGVAVGDLLAVGDFSAPTVSLGPDPSQGPFGR